MNGNFQYLGDFDIKTVNVPYLRSQIALVQQEPILFDTTILLNVTYGLKDIPFEKVTQAAKLANIHDFIVSLPEVRFSITIGFDSLSF